MTEIPVKSKSIPINNIKSVAKLVSDNSVVAEKLILIPNNMIGNTSGIPSTANSVALTPSALDNPETKVKTTANP